MGTDIASWFNPAWKHRRKITIPHARVSETLRDFPVLIALTDAAFRSTASGGRIAHPNRADFLFTASDGITALNHELETYDPGTGAIRAWVGVPVLSHTADTALYLYYGNPAVDGDRNGHGVWDAAYKMVLHLSGTADRHEDSTSNGNHGTQRREKVVYTHVNHAPGLNLTRAITVEAWVESQDARADAIQSIVSKWSLRRSLDAFDAYDAGNTDGLNTKGYFGAVFDGRYVYFSPQNDGTLTDGQPIRHGRVLRYDTRAPFKDPSAWSAYDAGNTSGLNTKGYYGAVATKRYVYFVPRLDGIHHHSRVLRYDRTGDFKDPKSWAAHDAGNPVSYQSAAYDGRHIYFTPGYEGKGHSGKVLRYDTHGPLDDPGSYATYDAGHTSGLNAKCYDGAVFDGRYVYFSPLDTSGIILRHDTRGAFTDPQSWTACDASRTSGLKMGACVGAIYDGRHITFVPYANSVAVRYDTHGDFTDSKSWTAYDASRTPGLKTKGYDGAFFDGKYVTFIPFYDGGDLRTGFHGEVLRYDATKAFTDPGAWDACDAGDTDGLRPIGFNGGAFDGRYLYCAPWRDGVDDDGNPTAHARVLRCDTTGSDASFSLRYTDCGHNGGLCAALPGPAFLINTDRGCLNARADRVLEPGRHHIAGVYDGRKIQLFIDGVLESESDGAGKIAVNDADILIGRIQDGLGDLNGRISEVRISGVARSAGWIKTGVDNQRVPSDFLRVGEEENAP